MAVSRVGCGELFLHVHRSQLNPSVPVTSFQCRQTCTATTALDTPTLLRQVAITAVPFKRALEYTRRRGTHLQRRFYDFAVFTEKKRVEKLRYMHCNPVQRGLVLKPRSGYGELPTLRLWRTRPGSSQWGPKIGASHPQNLLSPSASRPTRETATGGASSSR